MKNAKFNKGELHVPLSAQCGIWIVSLYVLLGLFSPFLSPYEESEIAGSIWAPPGSAFLLGTDHLGRDMLTRLLYGCRNTILIAFVTTIGTMVVGTTTGIFAAISTNWVDQLCSRIVDIILSFPSLVFVLLILCITGTSIPALIGGVAFIQSARVYRISRAVAIEINAMEYTQAARLRGESKFWLMTHEILPNAMPPLAAEFGLRFCYVILIISSLSFLGLGIQPPIADWGGMVRENAGAITFGMLTPIWPAIAIALLVVGVNLVVDWFLHLSSGISD
jgi:peptide/nickel transport system permease protein